MSGSIDSFGPLLRHLRRQRGMSCAELSRRSGVSLGHLSLIERDLVAPPRVACVKRLAACLGLCPAELLALAEQTRRRMHAQADQIRAMVLPNLTEPAAGAPFAVYVRALRVAGGLTQVALSQAARFDPGRLSDLEAGRIPPPPAVRVRDLARALTASPQQTDALLRLAAQGRRERGLRDP